MPGLTRPLAVILSITVASATHAAPDTALYGRLVATCSDARAKAACTRAFRDALARLGQPESLSDLDATLGLIAAAAVASAQGNAQIARQMAEILREAAKVAGDPFQARNLLIVAELVQNGRAKEVLSRIFPASPS